MLSKSTYCRFAFSYYENKAHGNVRVFTVKRRRKCRRNETKKTKKNRNGRATSTERDFKYTKNAEMKFEKKCERFELVSTKSGKNMNKNDVQIRGGIASESGGNGKADSSRLHQWSAQCAFLHGILLIPRLNNNNNNNNGRKSRQSKWSRRLYVWCEREMN